MARVGRHNCDNVCAIARSSGRRAANLALALPVLVLVRICNTLLRRFDVIHSS